MPDLVRYREIEPTNARPGRFSVSVIMCNAVEGKPHLSAPKISKTLERKRLPTQSKTHTTTGGKNQSEVLSKPLKM